MANNSQARLIFEKLTFPSVGRQIQWSSFLLLNVISELSEPSGRLKNLTTLNHVPNPAFLRRKEDVEHVQCT